MTLAKILEEVRAHLNDEEGATNPNPRFTTAKLTHRINEVHKHIANTTKVLQSSATNTLVVGTREYLLPESTDVLEVRRVEIINTDGDIKVLEPTTQSELDLADIRWKNKEGVPSHWYLRGKLIGIYPMPGSNDTGYTIRVEYGDKATDMVQDRDSPQYPDQYHQLIVWGVVEWCKLEDNDYEEASLFNQKFMQGMARMKSEQNDRIGRVFIMRPS